MLRRRLEDVRTRGETTSCVGVEFSLWSGDSDISLPALHHYSFVSADFVALLLARINRSS